MRTYTTKAKQIRRDWHLIDADKKILGRLASRASTLLMGKNKPYYSPHMDCGDHVVIINAKKIKVTGGKEEKKIYYRHSGYPGGFRQEQLKNLLERKPEEVIKRAVSGMLPKNRLRKPRLNKLHVYAESEHPHRSQIIGEKNAG